MLKQLKWRSLLLSAALIVAGVLLIVFPKLSASVICSVIGIGAIAFGIVNVVSYFLLDLKDTLYRNEFMIGVTSIISGLLIMNKQSLLIDLVPILLGLVIVASGLVKLQQSVVAYRIGYQKSLLYLILAAISVVLGLVVMFLMPGKTAADILFITIGCGLVYCGASDLFVTLFLANRFNAFLKEYENGGTVTAEADTDDDVIEGEFIEVEKKEEPEEPEVAEDPAAPEETKEAEKTPQ
ncbi:MAG: DUF308 domain-containing protein [Solobacterium sp.]|nr:DUF308 domain-containing protein [Solobacterium sp.]